MDRVGLRVAMVRPDAAVGVDVPQCLIVRASRHPGYWLVAELPDWQAGRYVLIQHDTWRHRLADWIAGAWA